jgi:hypothetical protein
MKYLSIFAILFGFLLISNPAFGYTASKFFSDYGEDLSKGQKIKVLVTVKGEPESKDPTKRAKEIRYLQSAVLKFCNFAGATNVKSDSWNNEFTAMVTTSLAQVLEERSDVISVRIVLPMMAKEGIMDNEDSASMKNMSPRAQMHSGIEPIEVVCKQGFELLLKANDGSPACVKPSTVQKLIERGWANS